MRILNKFYFDYTDDDEAKEKEKVIVDSLEGQELYEDRIFFGPDALYFDVTCPPKCSVPAKRIRWLRICDGDLKGMSLSPEVFSENNDLSVVQGALADCWFLSALSIMAQNRELLENVFVSTKHSSRGIYTLKFFKHGKWRYVHIDDRIPAGRSGSPFYSRSLDPNITWVMLIEKAYAKLHGCYESLSRNGGRTDHALQDLTSQRVTKLSTVDTDVLKDINNEDGIPFFERLRNLIEKPEEDQTKNGAAQLLGCSYSRRKAGREKDASLGILSGHGYGICRMEEIRAVPPMVGKGDNGEEVVLHLVQIYDSWGLLDWQGDWSEGDIFWKEYPTVANELLESGRRKRRLNLDVAKRFWMSWADFLDQFNQFYILHAQPPRDFSVRTYSGSWANVPGFEGSAPGGGPSNKTYANSPQYAFTIDTETYFCARLSQLDIRWGGKYTGKEEITDKKLNATTHAGVDGNGEKKKTQSDAQDETADNNKRDKSEDKDENDSSSCGYNAWPIGIVLVRIKEGKSRMHRFSQKKVEAISSFVRDRDVSLELPEVLKEGRYALIPTLLAPTDPHVGFRKDFSLRIETDLAVDWEVEEDQVPEILEAEADSDEDEEASKYVVHCKDGDDCDSDDDWRAVHELQKDVDYLMGEVHLIRRDLDNAMKLLKMK
eukprot:g3520.t1